MNYVGPRFPQHGAQICEHCRNSIFFLDGLRAIQVDIADRNRLDKFGKRLKSRTVTFRDVSGAKESDAESLVRSYLA
jgi:hypothetical protein